MRKWWMANIVEEGSQRHLQLRFYAKCFSKLHCYMKSSNRVFESAVIGSGKYEMAHAKLSYVSQPLQLWQIYYFENIRTHFQRTIKWVLDYLEGILFDTCYPKSPQSSTETGT